MFWLGISEIQEKIYFQILPGKIRKDTVEKLCFAVHNSEQNYHYGTPVHCFRHTGTGQVQRADEKITPPGQFYTVSCPAVQMFGQVRGWPPPGRQWSRTHKWVTQANSSSAQRRGQRSREWSSVCGQFRYFRRVKSHGNLANGRLTWLDFDE